MLVFEWDEAKRASNLDHHGVDFARAHELDWPSARYLPDMRRNYLEGRIQGFVLHGPRLHVIVFTVRHTGLRIISLRKANRRELRRYAEETAAHDS